MTQFILNNTEVNNDLPSGFLLLDYIRYHSHLKGTKIGCREGDCGACTILVGSSIKNKLVYKSATSCLMPLANAHGKHIVTIEGLQQEKLTAVQESFYEQSASQCGFCTPGFIMSLSGYFLNSNSKNQQGAIAAMDGNICRCTGYKSIERAASDLMLNWVENKHADFIDQAVSQNMVPEYFRGIANRLQNIPRQTNQDVSVKRVGGGTDLYVQQAEHLTDTKVHSISNTGNDLWIKDLGNELEVNAQATVSFLAESKEINLAFPNFEKTIKLISSTPIRNMATLAGNFVNASPIGDFSIFFLALKTTLILENEKGEKRTILFKDFFLSYKKTALQENEIIKSLRFTKPGNQHYFNFEKVCKRTHLDIASVNTACLLEVEKDIIVRGSLAAGGVGPVPLFLKKSAESLLGKRLEWDTLESLLKIVATEISPISDARGTATYKKLLLAQLIKAHFVKMFPMQFAHEKIFSL